MRSTNAPFPQAAPVPHRAYAGIATLATGTLALLLAACGSGSDSASSSVADPAVVAQGKETFRFDTFGDETQWTDTLRMHEVIAASVDPASGSTRRISTTAAPRRSTRSSAGTTRGRACGSMRPRGATWSST